MLDIGLILGILCGSLPPDYSGASYYMLGPRRAPDRSGQAPTSSSSQHNKGYFDILWFFCCFER